IFVEISMEMTVRNNIIRRSGWNGISLHTSKQIQVYGNTIEDSGSIALSMRVDCDAVGGGEHTGWDLANNEIHDNTVRVRTGATAANLFIGPSCPRSPTANEYGIV